MPGQFERIAEIEDPFLLLRAATERLAEARQEVTELSRLRRRLIQDPHAQGMSYAQIAEKAGLSRGRIHQIRHTGPAMSEAVRAEYDPDTGEPQRSELVTPVYRHEQD